MSELAAIQWTDSSSTPGWSDEVTYVTKQSFSGVQHLRESFTLGEENRAAKEELFDVSEDCAEPDWDGYGAEPVDIETYRKAFNFIDALPTGYPKPEIDAESDGHVTFDWHRSPRYTLSVSVSPDGYLYWSALLGPRKLNGSEPFLNGIPSELLQLVLAVKGT